MAAGWAPHMHDCMISFSNQQLDLDPTETNCCAWTKWVYTTGYGNLPPKTCGMKSSDVNGQGLDTKIECCGTGDNFEFPDCDHKYNPSGMGQEDAMDFMNDEQLWLKYYAKAWHMGTENGADLQSLD